MTTLKRYLALLEAIFLVRTIPAWSSSHVRRLVRTPKIDLCDPGLLAHALGLDTRRVAADPTLAGPLLETFVAAEVRKQLGWSVTRAAELHFRMHAGQEVDVVLEDPSGRVAGIEVKASASLSGADLRGLRALQEAAGDRFVRGVVLYLGDELLPFGERLVAAPMTALWGG
jgi:predicted AAA+ superfamily ATPase